MSNHKKSGKYLDVYRMMDYAESLLRVAKELQQKSSDAKTDIRLFEGVFLSVPILLSLATEIALKAWQFRELKEVNIRTHDLLKLFQSLKPSTQKMLEARMRKVSPQLDMVGRSEPTESKSRCTGNVSSKDESSSRHLAFSQ